MAQSQLAQSKKVLKEGLWDNNPIFRQVLGICSALAVTNVVLNTMVMCVSLTFVTAMSCLTVSVIRTFTPGKIRMMVQALIIAFYVIVVDVMLKAYWPEMSRNLGPYVGLIITNCIIMGRCEAFANSNKPLPSLVDGFTNGLGYSFILLCIAVIREIMGRGTLLGYSIPYFTENWLNWTLMVMPPGAFFVLGCMIWLFRSIQIKREELE